MVAYRRCALLCVLVPLLLSGCGGDSKDDLSQARLAQMAGGKLAETSPVSGVVTVDGTPIADVYIYAHANDEATPVSSCHTDGEGKFCFSSNLLCDGLPVGNYSLTFRLMPEVPKNRDIGPDLFKGKYKSPKKSETKLTVVAGTPQTEVKIDLKK